MRAIAVEVGDQQHVLREASAQSQHHLFPLARLRRVGEFTDEVLERFGRVARRGLIPFDGLDLVVVALGRAQQRVGDFRMLRMEVGEVLVVGERLFVAFVVEVRVRILSCARSS